jgi:acetolactate synthase-1/3 small subunit
VDRELVLVKINYSPKDKAKIEGILNKYVAKIIQHKADTAIIEIVGEQEQIKELLESLQQLGIKELVKTGRVAMAY